MSLLLAIAGAASVESTGGYDFYRVKSESIDVYLRRLREAREEPKAVLQKLPKQVKKKVRRIEFEVAESILNENAAALKKLKDEWEFAVFQYNTVPDQRLVDNLFYANVYRIIEKLELERFEREEENAILVLLM
jgi:hypothetical protein